LVLVNEVFKVAKRYDSEQLREYGAACVHGVNLENEVTLRPPGKIGFQIAGI
jgi:hypothetical protein